MATRLFLLRHGETMANIEQRYQGQGESHLSELGLSEAKELSKFLSRQNFSAVYSSPLLRSYETAKIIAKPHKLDVHKIPGMMERYYGVWENMRFDEIREKYPSVYNKWLLNPNRTRIPGAETLEKLQERAIISLGKLIKKHRGSTFCVIGHGGINRTILFHYMHIDLNNFWRIKQDNCCVNIIEMDKVPIVVLLNSTAFLGEKRIKGTGYY